MCQTPLVRATCLHTRPKFNSIADIFQISGTVIGVFMQGHDGWYEGWIVLMVFVCGGDSQSPSASSMNAYKYVQEH